MQRPKRLRVAVIGCGPPDQEPLTYLGSGRTIRGLVEGKLLALAGEKGLLIEPSIYWPAGNSGDYPEAGTYDAVIIPGSKLNIDEEGLEQNPWMHGLCDFIRGLEPEVPVLGICFGHQAIAVAHGGRVERIPSPAKAEVGFSPVHLTEDGADDALFRSLPRDFEGLFSHFTYVSRPPEGGRVLAEGFLPGMVQAYRIRDSVWGVQFHPDYSPGNIDELVECRREGLARMLDISQIRTINPQRQDHRVLENFLDHCFSRAGG
jgi:GMP synthase-like glutamine amidotransferase